MSDDLISRKSLLEEIQSFRCSITGLRAGKGILAHAADEYRKSILKIIEDQPVAFNKEKVIEELRKHSHNYYPSIDHYCLSKKAVDLKTAIEIAEKGGIE